MEEIIMPKGTEGTVTWHSGSLEAGKYIVNAAVIGSMGFDVNGKYASLSSSALGAQSLLSGGLDSTTFSEASGTVIQALNKLAANQGAQQLQNLSDTAFVSLDNGDFIMWNGSAFTDKTSLETLQQVVGSSITQAEVQVLDGADADEPAAGKAVLYGASGQLSASAVHIGGTAITATAAELNLLDGVTGLVQADFTKLAAVDASAAEIDLLDAGTAIGSAVGDLADGDGIIIEDGDVMKKLPLSDLATYIASKQSFDTAEEIQDTAGAMFTGNTETGITATYQDSDGTIDLAVSVAAAQIASAAVGADEIQSLGVGTAELQAGAVLGAKLGANVVKTSGYVVVNGLNDTAAGLVIRGKDIDGATADFVMQIDGGVLALAKISTVSESAAATGAAGT
jgi:hypothetical protein